MEQRLGEDDDFWCAFVELDKFKSINGKYGYTAADGLLQRVADQLKDLASESSAEAFRAHGDEFFLVGADAAPAGDVLEEARTRIAAMQVMVSGHEKEMSCTASVGWTTVQVMQEEAVTPDDVLDRVELAVDEAKWRGRNVVVKHEPTMTKAKTVEVRVECTTCKTRFSADLHRGLDGNVVGCPRCRGDVELGVEDLAALAAG